MTSHRMVKKYNFFLSRGRMMNFSVFTSSLFFENDPNYSNYSYQDKFNHFHKLLSSNFIFKNFV